MKKIFAGFLIGLIGVFVLSNVVVAEDAKTENVVNQAVNGITNAQGQIAQDAQKQVDQAKADLNNAVNAVKDAQANIPAVPAPSASVDPTIPEVPQLGAPVAVPSAPVVEVPKVEVPSVAVPELPAAPANIAVDASQAAPKAEAVNNNENWTGFSPSIEVSKWGAELKIIVKPSLLMKEEDKLTIQSVKLESDKGEFLGLKTYTPEEKDRSAEFTVNPEVLKMEAVKVYVNSSKYGNWIADSSLKVEEAPAAVDASAAVANTTSSVVDSAAKAVVETKEAVKDVAATKPAEASKKKKGWLW